MSKITPPKLTSTSWEAFQLFKNQLEDWFEYSKVVLEKEMKPEQKSAIIPACLGADVAEKWYGLSEDDRKKGLQALEAALFPVSRRSERKLDLEHLKYDPEVELETWEKKVSALTGLVYPTADEQHKVDILLSTFPANIRDRALELGEMRSPAEALTILRRLLPAIRSSRFAASLTVVDEPQDDVCQVSPRFGICQRCNGRGHTISVCPTPVSFSGPSPKAPLPLVGLNQGSSQYCFYHAKFGEAALKCRAPCNFRSSRPNSGNYNRSRGQGATAPRTYRQ